MRGDSHGVAAGERLLEERAPPMAAPGPLLGLPRPWTPAMLAGLPSLRSPLEPWQPWFRVAGLDWPEPCAGPRLLDSGMTLEAAANGQGVALARPSLARAWLAEGRLAVLFPLRSAPTHHYHLRSHQASPASQRFAAWLAAICREAVVQGREFLPAADDETAEFPSADADNYSACGGTSRSPSSHPQGVDCMSVITDIEDLRRLARKRVPRMFYDYADSGSWSEGTYRANQDDFAAIKLRQRVARNIENRSLRTRTLGQEMAMPVAIAPTGLAGMQHADGEILAARAAAEFGVRYTLSTMSICSLEDIATEVGQPFWFQLYVMRDRDFIERLIDRAKAAGCDALALTLDLQIIGQRHKDLKNGLRRRRGRPWPTC